MFSICINIILLALLSIAPAFLIHVGLLYTTSQGSDPIFLIAYPTPYAGHYRSSWWLWCPSNRTTNIPSKTSPDNPKCSSMSNFYQSKRSRHCSVHLSPFASALDSKLLTLVHSLVNSEPSKLNRLIQVYSPFCSLYSAMEQHLVVPIPHSKRHLFISVVPWWNKLPSSLFSSIQKSIEHNCSRTSNAFQNLHRTFWALEMYNRHFRQHFRDK